MITLEKLKIYSRYKGDIDMWARTGKSKEKQIMKSGDWYLIDSLIQDLVMVKNGIAAEQFIANLNKRLIESCDSQETIEDLRKMG